RHVAMATTMVRIATADFEWHGKIIKKGDLVYLLIAGANRDPRYFADPEKLDMARKEVMMMTFAPGLHHCIGHLLAKMQLGEFFPAFFKRFPRVEVADETLHYTPVMGFRGLDRLNLRVLS